MVAKLLKSKISILFLILFLFVAVAISIISSKPISKKIVEKEVSNKSLSKQGRKFGDPNSPYFNRWGEKIDKNDLKTKFNFEVKLPSEEVKDLTGNLKIMFAKKMQNANDKSDSVIIFFDNEKLELYEHSGDDFLSPDKVMEAFKNNDNYEQFKKDYQVIEVNGVKGLGREPGRGKTAAGEDAPGLVTWSPDGKIEYQLYGNGTSVEDLLKIAESLE